MPLQYDEVTGLVTFPPNTHFSVRIVGADDALIYELQPLEGARLYVQVNVPIVSYDVTSPTDTAMVCLLVHRYPSLFQNGDTIWGPAALDEPANTFISTITNLLRPTTEG